MTFVFRGAVKYLEQLENPHKKKNIPLCEIGDYVKIGLLIQEGNKERIQSSTGVIIAKNSFGISESITVRNHLQGIGVERIFLLNSPRVITVETLRKSKIRRSKLYYLRSRYGKSARLKTRFT